MIDLKFTQLINKKSFHASNQGQSLNPRREIYSLDIFMNKKLKMAENLIKMLNMIIMSN